MSKAAVPRKRSCWRAAGIVLLALCGWLVFELWYSYEYLTVARHEVELPGLKATVRAILLADLHEHEFGKENERLVEVVAAEVPDVIFLAGDMFNRDSADAHVVLNLIRRLVPIAPVYCSLGNHEIDYIRGRDPALMADMEDAGATVLDLSYEDVELNGQTIRVGGMYDYAFSWRRIDSDDPEQVGPVVHAYLTAYQDTELPKIMLAHRPDSFIFGQAAAMWDVDLVLSGHLHGGQVILPFFGGISGGDQANFPEYIHGLYEKERMMILITSGLGSNTAKIPRLNNPPEIVSLTLVPAKDESNGSD